MVRQIRLLLGCQLINLFGLNEVRYTKDKKKKARFMGLSIVWILLTLMLVSYVGGLSYLFIKMEMEQAVPEFLFAATSIIILFFSFFKAGNVIFQMNSYEVLITFPVSKTAIVVSRFLSMYVTNLLLSFLVMIPGMVVYGIFVKPQWSFYLYSIMGTLFLPLIPLSIATILGAGIMTISSRMRNKSLAQAFLMILLTMVVMVGGMNVSNVPEQINQDALKDMIRMAEEGIRKTYPPATWFAEAVNDGKVLKFLLLLMVSMLIFVFLVFVLQKYFFEVCSALREHSAKHNYQMGSLSTASPVKALWKKEVKRYFSSSIYVGNTMIGYLLMIVLSVAIFVAGIEKIEEAIHFSGIIKKVFPLLLGAMAGIMPTTACAVSMEGKQWWIAQTLPIRSKDIWNSKILLNLTIAVPCYLIALVFAFLSVKPSLKEGIFLVILPMLYIIFTAVAGITVNLAMPVFDWESEVNVVKQSVSVLVTMLIGLFSVMVPVVFLVLGGDGGEYLVYTITSLVLVLLTGIFYCRNNRKTVNL
ncbi:MAG: hypothetical protein IJA10_02055 [Lachnospiraceae bacterium]|nr:hypothetical protein [Lachnospiraceae bacterium]